MQQEHRLHPADFPICITSFTNIYEARYVSGVVAGLKLNEMIEDGTVKRRRMQDGLCRCISHTQRLSPVIQLSILARRAYARL